MVLNKTGRREVMVGGTNLIFTIGALFIIDRFGRRPLMLIGSVGTAASLALVAAAFYAEGEMGDLVLIGLLAFIACFAFSQGRPLLRAAFLHSFQSALAGEEGAFRRGSRGAGAVGRARP